MRHFLNQMIGGKACHIMDDHPTYGVLGPCLALPCLTCLGTNGNGYGYGCTLIENLNDGAYKGDMSFIDNPTRGQKSCVDIG